MAEANFGSRMKARLAAYQVAKGLSGDGVAGQKTWALLVKEGSTDGADLSVSDTADVPTKPDTITDESPAAQPLDPAEFPLSYALAQQPATMEGAKNFLLQMAGVDIDALIADMDYILSLPTVNTEERSS